MQKQFLNWSKSLLALTLIFATGNSFAEDVRDEIVQRGDRTYLGETIGQFLLGDDFQPGEDETVTFSGKTSWGKKCTVDFHVQYDRGGMSADPNNPRVTMYLLDGDINGKNTIYMQPFMPVIHTIVNETTDSELYLSYDSRGPCSAGILWGASCDQRSDTISAERDQNGQITRISLSSNLHGISPHPDFWTKSLDCKIEEKLPKKVHL